MVWCLIVLGGLLIVLALVIVTGVPLPRPRFRPGTMVRGCMAGGLVLIAGLLIALAVLLIGTP